MAISNLQRSFVPFDDFCFAHTQTSNMYCEKFAQNFFKIERRYHTVAKGRITHTEEKGTSTYGVGTV